MSQTSPEIEAILNDLTSLCCAALRADGKLDLSRVSQLVDSLSANGWERHSQHQAPLSTELERRVRQDCKEPAMHRGAELKSVVDQVQQAFDKTTRYTTSTPGDSNTVAQQAHPPRS